MAIQPDDAGWIFDQLVESAPEAVIVIDASGTIQLINGQVEQLFGYARARLIGAPVPTRNVIGPLIAVTCHRSPKCPIVSTTEVRVRAEPTRGGRPMPRDFGDRTTRGPAVVHGPRLMSGGAPRSS